MKRIFIFLFLFVAMAVKAQQNQPTETFIKENAYSMVHSPNEKMDVLQDVANYFPGWEAKLANGQMETLDLSVLYPNVVPTMQYQHFKIANSGYIITVLPQTRVQHLYNRSLIKSKK
jgi:hypothetical protein